MQLSTHTLHAFVRSSACHHTYVHGCEGHSPITICNEKNRQKFLQGEFCLFAKISSCKHHSLNNISYQYSYICVKNNIYIYMYIVTASLLAVFPSSCSCTQRPVISSLQLRDIPANIRCPSCHQNVTVLNYEAGLLAWLLVGVLFFFGFFL